MFSKRLCRVLAALAFSVLTGGPVFALPLDSPIRAAESRFEEATRGALRLFGLLRGTLSSLFEADTAASLAQVGETGGLAESGVTIDPDGTPAHPAN
jgi:hypothetical protein